MTAQCSRTQVAVTTLGSSRTSLGVPTGDHLAELQHDDAVADAEHEAHVVVDQQDRRASVDDLAQVAAEGDRLLRVEAGGRFVEAQQLGACGQRPGDGDELALALRELARRRLGEMSSSANTSSASSTAPTSRPPVGRRAP